MEKPSRFVTEDGSAVAFLIECSKIAEYQAEKMPEIYKVLRTRVQNYGEGPLIDMEVSVVYGYNVAEGLVEFKKKIVKEIENLTAMNVVKLDVVAKNIVVLEKN